MAPIPRRGGAATVDAAIAVAASLSVPAGSAALSKSVSLLPSCGATTNPFTLRALIDVSRIKDLGDDPNRNFYISAAIVPKREVTETDFGSFRINDTTYSSAPGMGMQFSRPVV